MNNHKSFSARLSMSYSYSRSFLVKFLVLAS
jgi:hypothetical protein